MYWRLLIVKSLCLFCTKTRWFWDQPSLLSKNVLHSLCPAPNHDKEIALQCLDVVGAVRVYLAVTTSVYKTEPFCYTWRTSISKTEPLIALPGGPRRGQPASCSTIASWIRQLISRAYTLRKQFLPFLSVPISPELLFFLGLFSKYLYPRFQSCHLVLCSHVFQVLLGGCSGLRWFELLPQVA